MKQLELKKRNRTIYIANHKLKQDSGKILNHIVIGCSEDWGDEHTSCYYHPSIDDIDLIINKLKEAKNINN